MFAIEMLLSLHAWEMHSVYAQSLLFACYFHFVIIALLLNVAS